MPETIDDKSAEKPEDWDDEMDGAWEAPQISNPDFKGEWKPKRIPNPAYKGEWEHPQIDNPEYVHDPAVYSYEVTRFYFSVLNFRTSASLASICGK